MLKGEVVVLLSAL